MACIIKSVSVSEEEESFLKDYNLSPSQLIKEKIWEMKGMLRNIAGAKIDKQARVIESYMAEVERLQKLLKENGILEEE
jgi:hypothetical protein